MKFARSAALFLSLISFYHSFSQSDKELIPGYYVVVGAYAPSRENVAQNYVDVLTRQGYEAKYGFNESRKLFFVYIKYFNTLKASLQSMQTVRSHSKFADAWVRVVPGDVTPQNQVALEASQVTASTTSSITPTTSSPQTTEVIESPAEEIEVVNNPEIVQHEKMTLGNTEVFLSLYNATNNRIIDGEVQVVDTERARQITRVKGNEYLLLPDPKSKSGQLTLICESFGYRKVQQEINYPLPLADTVKPYIDLMGTTLVVNFDMVRYHKGDITTLYNVYFYNDAAVMLPESKYELNSLLQMMQEDKDYKIRLHGHTNGNYHGKIVSMGDNKNYFSLDGSKQGLGTAKDLSRKRAEVIRDFLIDNGVAASRVEIKAWGGKRPIYDKRSVNAKKNVRVEVEILED
jgi:outer membrane protein OmpA-like peptidoglycan-associated protein